MSWLIGCVSYTPAPIDPDATLRSGVALTDEEAAVALERLEITRLFARGDVELDASDGVNFTEAFVTALVLSPRLEALRQEAAGDADLVLAVSGIGGVKINASDDGTPGNRRYMSGVFFDIWQLIGSETIARLHEAEWELYLELRKDFRELDLARRELTATRTRRRTCCNSNTTNSSKQAILTL
jgi:hypothetical protein